jgi:mono/diheme cytochrome c family protein
MKKHMLMTIVFLAIMSVSCSSDSDDGPMTPIPPNLDTSVTYAGTVKAIIDSNCISCHGDPLANGAPMPLLSFANVQESVQNRNLIGRIENGTMPPNGNLSDAQVLAIKGWEAGNFKP